MKIEEVFDKSGKLIGRKMRESDGNITLLDKDDMLLGRYYKLENAVYNRARNYVGKGESLLDTLLK
jgi:hypothetical protein